ncbi:hypothetical protein V8E36_002864 [Tilletia maclaganii]
MPATATPQHAIPASNAAGPSTPRITTASAAAAGADPSSPSKPQQSTPHVQLQHTAGTTSKRDQRCAHCHEPMTGQFVRALGAVYHLDCFRCQDCGKIVAAKFFPATDDMVDSAAASDPQQSKAFTTTAGAGPAVGSGTGSGKLFPLCETDYFKRLDLLCAKCGCALRGSYITALGMKFHVEHFTCSVCPTVFGPHDSYYEHDGSVYCHFHYSTRFAIKCTGCRTAILKQFVEINRNNVDEHWHPECYMIHKFWNIKICPTGSTPKEGSSIDHAPAQLTTSDSAKTNISNPSAGAITPSTSSELANQQQNSADISGTRPAAAAAGEPPISAEALEAESSETPATLRQKQRQMEQQVYRIWTVLSAFEESSAACISEMLRHVSHGRYLDGVRMAEKFILHVEILFSAIDDLEVEFRKEQAKGISHIREARMLCKKIVNFFSLLSHTQETGARRMDITQELLSLVTGLAHYLKILIRIALSGALRLDRDFNNHGAINWFLSQLAFLAREGTLSGDEKALNGSSAGGGAASNGTLDTVKEATPGAGGAETKGSSGPGTSAANGKWYGYKSLPRAATRSSSSSTEPGESATDLCVLCGQTVEEDCFRFGVPRRWHASCLRCLECKRPAALEPTASKKVTAADGPTASIDGDGNLPDPILASQFALEIIRTGSQMSASSQSAHGASTNGAVVPVPGTGKAVAHSVFCPSCAAGRGQLGFEPVTRLEQYAFLLRVALNRLFALLKKRGVVPPSPPITATSGAAQPGLDSQQQSNTATIVDGVMSVSPTSDVPIHEAYRDSADFKRMKTVNLDRKVSTKARVPHISTVMASPSGRHTTSAASPTLGAPPASALTGGGGNSADAQQQRTAEAPRSPQQANVPTHSWSASPIDKEQPRIPRRSHSPSGRPPMPSAGPPAPPPQAMHMQSPGLSGREPSPARRSTQAPPPSAPSAGMASGIQGIAPGSIVPIRPAFARHNTDVRIRNDGPVRDPSGDEGAKAPLGENSAEDGITLADIPHILEAEQHRGSQHPLSSGRYISELSALELFIIKHMAVMVLQQSALKDLIALDDLLEFIETRKNTFWGKIFKGGDKKKEVKKKGVFGIPLEILVERNGADSTLGASASHLRVPSFIDDIISAMKQMDVSVEGIFRKNGNIRRLKELSEALDRDSSQVNLLDDNPVQLAALMKKWLRELPDPLLTFKLHKLFVASQKLEPESERLRILHMVTILLPKGHRDTMEVLFVFLKWVASFSHVDEETGSKMDLQNLALVLGPNILYSKGADPTKDETFLANAAIGQLLDHQDDFWTVPEDLEGILQDRELLNPSADLTSRDILKKCERYAQRRRTNTNGGGGSGGLSHPHHAVRAPPARASDNLHVETVNSRHQPSMHPANARQHLYSQPPSAIEDAGGPSRGAPQGLPYTSLRSAPAVEGYQARRSSVNGPTSVQGPGVLAVAGPASASHHGSGGGGGAGGAGLGGPERNFQKLSLKSSLPGAALPPNQPRTPISSHPSTPARERERPHMDSPHNAQYIHYGGHGHPQGQGQAQGQGQGQGQHQQRSYVEQRNG